MNSTGISFRQTAISLLPFCAHCGVTRVRSLGNMYCSSACLRAAHPHPLPFCSWCGVNRVVRKRGLYCSAECRRAANPNRGQRLRITPAMLEAAYANVYRTLEDVSGDFGVTRERIRQRVDKYGIDTHRIVRPKLHCEVCGKPVKGKTGHCRQHLPLRGVYVIVHCRNPECGKPFSMLESTLAARLRHSAKYSHEGLGPFCSKHCCGKVTSRRYGIGSPNMTAAQRNTLGQRGSYYPQSYYTRRAKGLCAHKGDGLPLFPCQEKALPGSLRCAAHQV